MCKCADALTFAIACLSMCMCVCVRECARTNALIVYVRVCASDIEIYHARAIQEMNNKFKQES